MSTFGIDEDMIMGTISQALEDAAYNASQEQFADIANKIDDRFPGMLDLISRSISEAWKSEAREVGGWGSKYAEAITYKTNGDIGEVYLDEEKIDPGSSKPFFMFAMMVEQGVSSWSIKDALMKSDKVKVGKDGVRYIIVPFPVATPRSKTQGKMQSKFGKREMSQEIYNLVKGGKSLKSGTLKTGEDVSGLTKYQTRQQHSGYGIFRRVTQDSKGWQFPDKSPRPVYNSVLKEVNKTIHEAVSEFCKNVVKEFTT